MALVEVELTRDGSLRLTAAVAERYFPADALVARVVDRELWLVPVRGQGGGGMLLKQRNRAGDRAVLISEVLPPDVASGDLPAFWDESRGALRVALLPAPSSSLSTSSVTTPRQESSNA